MKLIKSIIAAGVIIASAQFASASPVTSNAAPVAVKAEFSATAAPMPQHRRWHRRHYRHHYRGHARARVDVRLPGPPPPPPRP